MTVRLIDLLRKLFDQLRGNVVENELWPFFNHSWSGACSFFEIASKWHWFNLYHISCFDFILLWIGRGTK
ncbi:MAG: hypothetical protein DWQ02_25875 [Bacteroidetes bacterium]|nr:MAG: hypothetical protein DWQ02_25875 [Bacteroidota bacterium]